MENVLECGIFCLSNHFTSPYYTSSSCNKIITPKTICTEKCETKIKKCIKCWKKKRNSGDTYFKTIGATERGRGGNSTAWLSPQNIFREMRQKFLNVYTLRYHPPTRKIRKKRFFFSFGPTYPHFCETKVLDLATQFGNLELLVF